MDTQSLLYLSALILTLVAAFGWINARYLKLPLTIGLMVIALAASLTALAIDAVLGLTYVEWIQGWVRQVDFYDSLMLGMLQFLLFAGALHVNVSDLLQRKWHVLLMATMGVALSTGLLGVLSYGVLSLLGFDIPLIWCFVFGALISPTDPVAVLSVLRTVQVPRTLRAKIAGESLFNDGVGVVVFLALLGIAINSTHGGDIDSAAHHADTGALAIAQLFFNEVVIGVAIGLSCGWLSLQAMRKVDDYVLEVIITLALVTSVYALCLYVHASGPLAVVMAGLLIGEQGGKYAMSDITHQHIEKFWELIDEILNAVLFLLLGVEIFVIAYTGSMVAAMLIMIPIVLLARSVAVTVPVTFVKKCGVPMTKGATPVLIWGGIRGGISVALALALPDFEGREVVLAMTYGIVVFSIIVQGLTIQKVIRKFIETP